MNKKRCLISALSVIVIVGVALAVVGVVHYNQQKNNTNVDTDNTSTHSKVVSALCESADNPELCHNTLANVNSTDPKDYIKAVVESAMEVVISSFNLTDSIQVAHGSNATNGIKMAVSDCKELLQSAIDDLQASGLLVQNHNARSVTDREDDLKNWLSAVIAYQQSCLDGFEDKNEAEKAIQKQLKEGGLDHVEKATALALDIVSGVSQLLEVFDLDLDVVKPTRKLLGETIMKVDNNADPTWMNHHEQIAVSKAAADKPSVVVAQDGTGDYKTIQAAVNAYPENLVGRYVIYVKAGIYNETVKVTKNQTNILMYGDGPSKTIVTGNRSFTGGWKTIQTATFTTLGDGFVAKSMAFENTAGAEGHQAVALRVMGDRSAFFDCAIRGYQDTLYAHAKRQLYRNCEISGTVDFIFGYASTLVQNSTILLRMPMENQQNIVAADGTADKQMRTGIVIQNCRIMPDASLAADKFAVRSYLARPWKAYSRAIFMENEIDDVIQPEGYLPWLGSFFLDTCYFAEFSNTGAGASTKDRVTWGHGELTREDAQQYTAEAWIQASTWVPATGITYAPSFTTKA